LSNDAAERSKVSAENFQVGDQVCQKKRHSARRLLESAARPRSVLRWKKCQIARSRSGGPDCCGANAS